VASSGCAIFKSAAGGNLAAAAEAAKKEAILLKESGEYGGAQCEPIKTSELALAEEKAVGSSMGVALAMKGGHFFIDGNTEKNGEDLAKAVEAKQKVVLPDSPKNDLTAYVAIVGRNLARYSERPDIGWTFGVIENEAPNAFSAPGGYVFVTTGLLKKITNEAQLAGVLGHEIGHVSHRHALKAYKSAKHLQCSAALAAGYYADRSPNLPDVLKPALKFSKKFGPGGKIDLDAPDDSGFVPWVINKVLEISQLSGNAKEDEFDADAVALQLVAFAGYDPSEYENFLTSLGSQGGGLFEKHPSTADRVGKLKALREGDLAPFCAGTAKPDVSKPFTPLKPQS
jgi:hypothetical protein